MDIKKIMKLPACGGCMAKLPPGMLKEVVRKIPVFNDPDLLVGLTRRTTEPFTNSATT